MQKAIVDYNGMDEVERIIVDFDCIESTGMFLICQNLNDGRFVLINKDHVLKIELDNMDIDEYKVKYGVESIRFYGARKDNNND